MITYFGKNRRKRDWHKIGASYGHLKKYDVWISDGFKLQRMFTHKRRDDRRGQFYSRFSLGFNFVCVTLSKSLFKRGLLIMNFFME